MIDPGRGFIEIELSDGAKMSFHRDAKVEDIRKFVELFAPTLLVVR